MPAYKDEKSGKWFASFYYKDWDGQSRKKLKRGFETKKEAITCAVKKHKAEERRNSKGKIRISKEAER